MAAWDGPRHRSWASNTALSTIAFAIIFVTYLVWEGFSEAPTGLITILGAASGTWFGAVSSDKQKKEVEKLEKAANGNNHD